MKRQLLLLIILIIAGAWFKLVAQTSPAEKELSSGWEFHKVGNNNWYPATVPGCIHTDLLANKQIADPFFRDNESKLQWIDKNSWEYKTSFDVNDSLLRHGNINLCFKGLDTYAEVFLNDVHILQSDNMFCEWNVDVKNKLREGKNILRVLFHSPVVMGLLNRDKFDLEAPLGFNFDFTMNDIPQVGPFTRKAQYMYGWDWGPKLTTSGIWRPVLLRTWDNVRFSDFQIIQKEVSAVDATVSGILSIQSDKEQKASVQVTYSLEGKNTTIKPLEVELHPGNNDVKFDIDIKNPALWWPNGLGKHPLYDFNASIGLNGAVADHIKTRSGLRNVKLVRKPDEDGGTTFYFEVNGVPVFAKGANYIPSDVFPSRVTDQHYKEIISAAADAHMNMLRVWGGGIYENDIFYNLCDENGIMVWQDFAFAIYHVPDYPEFYASIKQELMQNIRRLRNHPSIVLWCGNNETEMIWDLIMKKFFGFKLEGEKNMITDLLAMLPPPGKVTPETTERVVKGYDTIFYHIIPEALSAYDYNSHEYWPSSPIADWKKPITVKRPNSGDTHFYIAVLNLPFSAYLAYESHFFSEHGFQAWPDRKAVYQFTNPSDRSESSPIMAAHNKALGGNAMLMKYVTMYYQKPKDFDSYLYVSQVLQAEGMKLALETHRRWMPYTMGTLYWQLNDVWPVASWASLDYQNNPKALQYFATKAFNPVLVVASDYKNEFKVNVVSDRLESEKATLDMKIRDFHGKQLWSKTEPVQTSANNSKVFFNSPTDKLVQGMDTSQIVFEVKLWKGKELLTSNVLYFAMPKNLKLEKPEITRKIVRNAKGYAVTLTTNKLAKNVYLFSEMDGRFSDNYFDLLPGEPVTVTFTSEKDINDFESKLAITSLFDSFGN